MKETKGITLIALIITIILMLILTGTTVQVVINSNLFDIAKDAGEQMKEEYEKEKNGPDITINGVPMDEWIQSQCEHEWGEWNIIKEPTYTQAGERNRTCKKCGLKQTEYPSMLVCDKHTYSDEDWIIDKVPTCIEIGKKHVICTKCGTEIVEEIAIDKVNGHNYVNRVCTLCGNNINTAPTLSVSTSNITTTTANIMASSTDADYDALSATLVINGKTYTSSGAIGTTITPLWQITGLSPLTTYEYTVTVTDGYETVTKTGSITTLACTHNYVGSICSVCGDKKPLADDIDYTGYYADIDGDPTTVEGVIAYVIPYNISECYEYYYISDESYTDDFGTMPVISYIDDSYTTSIYNSPFYVLALDDFSYNGYDTFYWYYEYPEINLGYNTIDYYYGFELTDYMMEEYEYREDYVERDIWSCIEEKWQEGWFVPADFEWRYFVDNLFNGSWSSYSPCGLSQCYWTSTNGEDHQGFSRRMVF